METRSEERFLGGRISPVIGRSRKIDTANNREREREREEKSRYSYKINFIKHDCQRIYKILYSFYFLETFILLNFLSYECEDIINRVSVTSLVLYFCNKFALLLFLFID